jgi:DNA-binding protein H-NS
VDINLNELSLKELKDLQSQVSKAIATFEDRRKRAALAEVEEMLRAKGFSLSDVASVATKGKSISAPKYANPANPDDTWTGRGRKPKWFTDGIAAGKSPEDMSI